jgi:SAM-dependent methyltransferase
MPENKNQIYFEALQEKKEKSKKVVLEIGTKRSPAYIRLGKSNSWFRNEVTNSQYICMDIVQPFLQEIPDEPSYTEPSYRDFVGTLQIEKVYASGLQLPFSNNSLDDVVLVNVLNFRISNAKKIRDNAHFLNLNDKGFQSGALTAKQMEDLLEEIYRVIKVGGKLVIANFYNVIDSEATECILEGLKNDLRYNFTLQPSESEGVCKEVIVLIKK